jgi:Cu+-exporting ATPase
VVTNALRLRQFRQPASVEAILHPPLRERVGEYAYLVGIALVAIVVGVAAMAYVQPSHQGANNGSVHAAASEGTEMSGEEIEQPDQLEEGKMIEHEAHQPEEPGAIQADVSIPASVVANEPFALGFQFHDANGAPLTDLVISHERLVHLIVVRTDLGVYTHLHPEQTTQPGEFVVEVELPTGGNYWLFAEVARANGEHAIVRELLSVAGEAAAWEGLVARKTEQVVESVRVTLAGAEAIRVGEPAAFTFEVEDATSGKPVQDLQPYLGAPAHVVILDEGGEAFAHVHGTLPVAEDVVHGGHGGQREHSSHSDVPAVFGPTITASHVFTEAGVYKVWLEFQTSQGQPLVADFVVRVQ